MLPNEGTMMEVVDVHCTVYFILISLFSGEVLVKYLRPSPQTFKNPRSVPKGLILSPCTEMLDAMENVLVFVFNRGIFE